MYEGGSGSPATANDCASYAETIGNPSFPVFADGTGVLMGATPMTQRAHPELCGLTPDLEIMNCYAGHKAYLSALDDIRTHAGL